MTPFERVGFAEHVDAANPPDADPDPARRPEARGLVAIAAKRLEPLHRIQVAFDQMVRNVEDALRRRDETGARNLDPATRQYVRDEFAAVARHANALEAAHGAARSMLATMAAQLGAIDGGLADLIPAAPAPSPAPPAAPRPEAPKPAAPAPPAPARGK